MAEHAFNDKTGICRDETGDIYFVCPVCEEPFGGSKYMFDEVDRGFTAEGFPIKGAVVRSMECPGG